MRLDGPRHVTLTHPRFSTEPKLTKGTVKLKGGPVTLLPSVLQSHLTSGGSNLSQDSVGVIGNVRRLARSCNCVAVTSDSFSTS